jgi:hypothetical protein
MRVLGFIDNAHAPFADFFDDLIMAKRLADHEKQSLHVDSRAMR